MAVKTEITAHGEITPADRAVADVRNVQNAGAVKCEAHGVLEPYRAANAVDLSFAVGVAGQRRDEAAWRNFPNYVTTVVCNIQVARGIACQAAGLRKKSVSEGTISETAKKTAGSASQSRDDAT